MQLLDYCDREGRAQGNKGVGTQSGGAVVQLPVEPDQPAEQSGDQQIHEQFELAGSVLHKCLHGHTFIGQQRNPRGLMATFSMPGE
ncbi:hypothetical protein D9M69_725520 [compost metagenome]